MNSDTAPRPPMNSGANTPAHTPGPWRVGFAPDYCPKPEEDRCEIACLPHPIWDALDVFGKRTAADAASHEEHFANASLIAAAPDLLAAAKHALATAESWIHDQLDGTSSLDGELAELEPVRAAIAKAEAHEARAVLERVEAAHD